LSSVNLVVAAAAVLALVPLFAGEYWLNAILVPFLIMSLAGLGLNLVMGYTGQASLGTGAFMSVGAYATYNILLRLPELPLPVSLAPAAWSPPRWARCSGFRVCASRAST
jgi:branched-chain amino acid transport system permease protein